MKCLVNSSKSTNKGEVIDRFDAADSLEQLVKQQISGKDILNFAGTVKFKVPAVD